MIVGLVKAWYDKDTNRVCFKCNRDEVYAVNVSPDAMQTISKMARDYPGWAECRVEDEDNLMVVWKVPTGIGIRIEEPTNRSFSSFFHDHRALDLSLVFEAQSGVEAKGHGHTEYDS